MDFFLIDYENVNAPGLNGLKNLTEEDVVVIFYSDKADTMTFGLHRRLNESRAEIRYQKVAVGTRNALDFQLCSYLGYVIAQNAGQEVNYYVISCDREYEVLSNYWRHRKINVIVSANLIKKTALEGGTPGERESAGKEPSAIGASAGEQAAGASAGDGAAGVSAGGQAAGGEAETPKRDPLAEELSAVLPEGSLDAVCVAAVIRNSATKVAVSNALTREFMDRGYDDCTRHAGVVYRLIKPWIAGKPGG